MAKNLIVTYHRFQFRIVFVSFVLAAILKFWSGSFLFELTFWVNKSIKLQVILLLEIIMDIDMTKDKDVTRRQRFGLIFGVNLTKTNSKFDDRYEEIYKSISNLHWNYFSTVEIQGKKWKWSDVSNCE